MLVTAVKMCVSASHHTHTLTHPLSLVFVVMMKLRELKSSRSIFMLILCSPLISEYCRLWTAVEKWDDENPPEFRGS